MLATMVLDGSGMTYDLESSFPTLKNAPITEALIDIRVELPSDVDIAALHRFYEGLEDRFPKIDQRMSMSATLDLKQPDGGLKGNAPKPDGYMMRSEEKALVVQARLDGFTINKLTPYHNWKSFSDEAKELWERYVRIARPSKVIRLALRYTNRIEVLPGREFKEFVLTFPEVAPGIPQILPEYFLRLVIPHPSGSTAIVMESSLPSAPEAENVSMLLDIDVFRAVDIPPTQESTIWSTLEELRAYKNLIFFQTITPTQMEKYK
jgi:uncharacterized protein (TIGR04255 family)